MKRMAAFILIAALPIVALAGCKQPEKKDSDQYSVVCTIFPQYDWVRQILGDKSDLFSLTLLLNSKIDLHNYQPTVDDIIKISTCDLFIYVGGESDKWADDVLKEASNQNRVVINLVDALGAAAKPEELLEGMEEEEEDDDDGSNYDEHVWLSLKNAATFCSAIADALSSLDADHADAYRGNLAAYTEKLLSLDAEYQAAADSATLKTLLFGDRFPFRYLVDDYGLTAYAAFSGCSAETEASFETIFFLAKKIDECNLKMVMITESADQSIAETIVNNTTAKNQRILVLDAMQSVTSTDVQNGATYVSVMESNLRVLKEALS